MHVESFEKLQDTAIREGIRCLSCRSNLCIACGYCAMVCPVKAIRIVADQDELGRVIVEKFEINTSACIFCGLCQHVCPTNAIEMEGSFEFAIYKDGGRRFDEDFCYDEFEAYVASKPIVAQILEAHDTRQLVETFNLGPPSQNVPQLEQGKTTPKQNTETSS